MRGVSRRANRRGAATTSPPTAEGGGAAVGVGGGGRAPLPPPHRVIRGAASTFTLTLYGPFPAAAADAVAAGIRVWADVWPSAVPVAVGALWSAPARAGGDAAAADATAADAPGALAHTTAPVFVRGRAAGLSAGPGTGGGVAGGTGRVDTMYGWAMANAMAGEEVLAGQAATAGLVGADRYHLFVSYDGRHRWYTGADAAAVGAAEWDVATVTVHEVAHGLFFQGQLTAGAPAAAVVPPAGAAGVATRRTARSAPAPTVVARCNDTAGMATPAGTAATAGTVRQAGAAAAAAATPPPRSVYHLDPARAAADCAAAGLRQQQLQRPRAPLAAATATATAIVVADGGNSDNEDDDGVAACVGAMTPSLVPGVSARYVGTALRLVMAAMMDDTVPPAAEGIGGGACSVGVAPLF
ncbi:hypothetical protein I4F81_006992 [Pyropia yezoensis]|uniref:Uncharacterized protein n=1 Tax=Pyropia yezoensis TaxID=2788 RepID=A0ACC3C3A5_PYRYE|nr:hypothetical protein I4F81_006992 [Neopyropia yezoensis]